MIKTFFSWVGRKGVLLIVVMLAIAFYDFVLPHIRSEESRRIFVSEFQNSEEVATQLVGEVAELRARATQSSKKLAHQSANARRTSLRERRAELAEVERQLANPPGWFASMRPSVRVERSMLEPRKQVLEAEIRLLEVAGEPAAARADLAGISTWSERQVANAQLACDAANAEVREFNAQPLVEKFAQNRLHNRSKTLSDTATENCSRARTRSNARDAAIRNRNSASRRLARANQRLAQAQQGVRQSIENVQVDFVERTFVDVLKKALLILLGIIAAPYITRLIFYWILAPLAERRASIRIAVPGENNVAVPPSEQSRVSIAVTLATGEELLVRQDYLQTSSLQGSKSTRWLLDYRHPLSSIASGLSFLTRIRGGGETTTVSAVRDPFAELTQVKLPDGAACVLHPRALVAVVQPIGRTMKITSHWRLFSLNAWLTMQLRYLVFHGPGKLIVMGGRGIRAERAESGRIFGQDQLVGFSSDLAYSVTRTETFWPYFFGREQLFKDKVEQGNGVLIIEEAPLSSRTGSGVKRGLESAFDAARTAFGI